MSVCTKVFNGSGRCFLFFWLPLSLLSPSPKFWLRTLFRRRISRETEHHELNQSPTHFVCSNRNSKWLACLSQERLITKNKSYFSYVMLSKGNTLLLWSDSFFFVCVFFSRSGGNLPTHRNCGHNKGEMLCGLFVQRQQRQQQRRRRDIHESCRSWRATALRKVWQPARGECVFSGGGGGGCKHSFGTGAKYK